MSGKRKRGYYKKCAGMSKRAKSSSQLQAGMEGFMVTCANGQEKPCVREAYNLLNEYADGIYGPEKIAQNAENLEIGENEDSDEDVSDAIKKEVAQLKSAKHTPRRFQQQQVNVKNVLFIRCRDIDPLKVIYSLLDDIYTSQMRKARYILRMLPVSVTCKADVDAIPRTVVSVLEQVWGTGHLSHEAESIGKGSVSSVREVEQVLSDEVQKRGSEDSTCDQAALLDKSQNEKNDVTGKASESGNLSEKDVSSAVKNGSTSIANIDMAAANENSESCVNFVDGKSDSVLASVGLPDVREKADNGEQHTADITAMSNPVKETCRLTPGEGPPTSTNSLAAKVDCGEATAVTSITQNSFCIELKRRNSTLERDRIIGEVARAIRQGWPDVKTDLKTPKYTILIDILTTVCCVSVVENYAKYKKFNLCELVK